MFFGAMWGSAMGERVFVTGAAGLLGRRVVTALLEKGYDVHAVDRTEAVMTLGCQRADVVDLERWDGLESAVADADVLVHIAAVTDVANVPPRTLFDSNVMMTSRLLHAEGAAGLRKIVYASSQSALGFSRAPQMIVPDYLPVDERHRCYPVETYGVSKLVGEQLCAVVETAHGVPTLSLRFPVIWAPETFEADISRRLGNPAQAPKSFWSYVDVRDAARAVVLGVSAETEPREVLNISARWSFCDGDVHAAALAAYGAVPSHLSGAPDAPLYAVDRAADKIGFLARYRWSTEGIADMGTSPSGH
jgi:UDP-glucose 4-epimerase